MCLHFTARSESIQIQIQLESISIWVSSHARVSAAASEWIGQSHKKMQVTDAMLNVPATETSEFLFKKRNFRIRQVTGHTGTFIHVELFTHNRTSKSACPQINNIQDFIPCINLVHTPVQFKHTPVRYTSFTTMTKLEGTR